MNTDKYLDFKEEEWIGQKNFVQQEILLENRQEFQDCTFLSCHFLGELQNSIFLRCRFQDCDFSNQNLQGSSFLQGTFLQTRMVGSDFSHCLFSGMHMEDCNLEYSNFHDSTLKKTMICSCKASKITLTECKLDHFLIENNQFVGANFTHTNLKNIRLSGNDIEGIVVLLEDLRGAKIDSYQALLLIRLLGVEIEGEDL